MDDRDDRRAKFRKCSVDLWLRKESTLERCEVSDNSARVKPKRGVVELLWPL
ncbi:hypothetical protein OXX79_014447, partial [Metschnikowia pulcherrima]